MRRSALLLLIAACGCVTLTPQGKLVTVASASLEQPPALRMMPDGCTQVTLALKDEWMSEQEIEGQADPFRRQRNAAGGSGANVLLVLKRMSRGRRGIDCPNGSSITDCAPYSGAWFSIEFESYQCSTEALRAIAAAKVKK
jgi:hypothetical protein